MPAETARICPVCVTLATLVFSLKYCIVPSAGFWKLTVLISSLIIVKELAGFIRLELFINGLVPLSYILSLNKTFLTFEQQII